MGSLYGKGLRGKATRLHAERVRARGACENCGRRPPEVQLQCAHIVSRRYAATRCRLDNAFCLCAACHRFFTEWPLEFRQFVHETIGVDTYDQLKAAAQAGVKANDAWWQQVIDELEAA